MKRWIWSCCGCLVVFSMTGCQSYEPRPLDGAAIVATADLRRRGGPAPSSKRELSLGKLAEWMVEESPEVRELLARHRLAVRRASLKTPWPNPSLELGPNFGFGPAVNTNTIAPFGALAFAIPLGDRLGARDEVNAAQAEVARIDVRARCRELYVELRARGLRVAVAAERMRLLEESLEGARARFRQPSTAQHMLKQVRKSGSSQKSPRGFRG